ncbi:predicted protein [Chaetoceros tenuissimus]|uniref:Uncharacterized protein n=1 Tax=Chaetoceros tenuissimus TaxID=426638 RepID=A0AAD3CR96_9STRA|nr:predicted protein [Chaetoceros tenuissimus]
MPDLDVALLNSMGMAKTAPKGVEGIVKMLVGILTSEGIFSEDEVPKAEKFQTVSLILIEAYKNKVSVEKFLQNRENWKNWIKSTKLAFTVSMQKQFLDSDQKCMDNLKICRQNCATLLLAFNGTNQASTVEKYSSDNASEFWKSIQSNSHDAINMDEEQWLAWQEVLVLESSLVHKYDIFSSNSMYCLKIIKCNNSVALLDLNLMLASLQ